MSVGQPHSTLLRLVAVTASRVASRRAGRLRQAAAVILSAACGISLAGCAGTATASRTAAPAAADGVSYSALSIGPSHDGIAVIPPSEIAAASRLSADPLWIAVTPRYVGAALPDIQSAREIGRVGTARLWIARSTKRGICLLEFDPSQSANPARAHRVVAECGYRAELPKGIVMLNREAGGRNVTTAFGLVPDGVARTFAHFGDGTATAVTAARNFYSFTTDKVVKSITFFGRDGTPITAIKIGATS